VAAGAPPPVAAIGDAGGAVADLASQAQEHYRRAMQAQRDGNWALYGDEIKRLGEVLELIQRPR
jgi:uncharacterized protein